MQKILYKLSFPISLIIVSLHSHNVFAATETCIDYTFTGSPETLLLPPKITEIRVTATGADGGDALANNGGSGAIVSGTILVNPTSVITNGDTLSIIVGEVGENGDVSAGAENQTEAGGGGGTGIIIASSPLFVAGAGGGGDNTGLGGGATIPGVTATGASDGTTPTGGGTGGTGGNGGGGGNDGTKPGNGGGGGFFTNGGSGLAALGAATGGGACTNLGGGTAGLATNEELGNGSSGQAGVDGGYGCGGGGGAGHRESGGGGGYNGGGGGGAGRFPGGGGSFIETTAFSVNNTAGINSGGTASNGSAQICYDVPDANLSITKDDGESTFTPGDNFTYTLTAVNAGPDDSNDAVIADTLPMWATNVTWECTASTAGAMCPSPAMGSGNLNETINTFPAFSTLTFEISGTYSTNMIDY